MVEDFTQNKDVIRNAIYHLYFPGFSESNVFDAILETVDRLKDVSGKKSILVLASGVDTFSKHTLDQTDPRFSRFTLELPASRKSVAHVCQ